MIRQLVIILAAFALIWYAINVPAQQIRMSKSASNGRISEMQNETPTFVGGFPWKYCEFQRDSFSALNDEQGRNYRLRSNANFWWNVALGIAIAFCLAGLIVVSGRKQKKLADKAGGGGMQISLSGLLALVTIFAGVFGYYRIGNQRLIDDMHAFADSGGNCRTRMEAPKWLGNVIDLSFLMKVERGTFNRSECSDAQFKRIAKMRSLTSVSISHASSSDITAIANLPKLRTLSISECELTDDMLDAIAGSSSIGNLVFRSLQSAPTTAQMETLQSIITSSDKEWALTLGVFPNAPLRLSDLPQLRSLSLEWVNESPPLSTGLSSGLPFQYANEVAVQQAFGVPLIPDAKGFNVDGLSVELDNLTGLVSLNIQTPLSDLTIRNSPILLQLSVPLVVERLKVEHLTSLRNLHIGNTKFPKEIHLKDLPALLEDRVSDYRRHGLSFGGTWTESMIKSLGEHAAALIQVSSITTKALVAWLPKSRLTRLRFGPHEIRIHSTLELDADFDSLVDLTEIESFVASAHSWDDSKQPIPYQLISKLPNLRELQLDQSFTDADAQYLTQLTKLEIFHAMETQLTDEGWSKLPVQSNLRAVSIPKAVTRLTFRDLPKLESLGHGFASLKSIELENLPSLVTGLRVDARSKLEEVRIKNVREVDLELYRLPQAFELRSQATHVLAQGEWLDDETLPKIVSPKTVKLNIARSSITSKSIDFLLTLKSLRHLDVSQTDLRDADIKRLINESEIKTIQADIIDLSQEALDALPSDNATHGLRRGFSRANYFSFPSLDE